MTEQTSTLENKGTAETAIGNSRVDPFGGTEQALVEAKTLVAVPASEILYRESEIPFDVAERVVVHRMMDEISKATTERCLAEITLDVGFDVSGSRRVRWSCWIKSDRTPYSPTIESAIAGIPNPETARLNKIREAKEVVERAQARLAELEAAK
jgi:hypothetical protein